MLSSVEHTTCYIDLVMQEQGFLEEIKTPCIQVNNCQARGSYVCGYPILLCIFKCHALLALYLIHQQARKVVLDI